MKKLLLLTSLLFCACKKNLTEGLNEHLITISTGRAQIKHITLPDSTEIILNAESYVSYRALNYSRVIWVDGNVYVKIKPDGSDFFIRHDSVTLISKDAELNYDNSEGKAGIHYSGYGTEQVPAKMGVVKGTLYAQTAFASGYWYAGQAGTISNYTSLPFPLDDLDEQISWINGYYKYDYAHFDVLCRLMSRTYNINVLFGKNSTDALIGSIYLDINQPASYLLADSALNSKIDFSVINDSTLFAKPR